MPKAPRLLTALEINEVSVVDEPANEDARIVLLKAANAVPGVTAIRKALADLGGEAAEAFDNALAENGDTIAALVAKEKGEDLAVMAHALGESIASIVESGDADQRDELIAETTEQFTKAVAEAAEAEGIEKAQPGAPKGKGDGFKPCGDCPDIASSRAAGACAAEKVAKAAGVEGDLTPISAFAVSVQKAAQTFAELNAGREEREKLNRMVWALQDSISSIMSDPETADKKGAVLKSVEEFNAAVQSMAGELESVSKAAGGAGDKESGAMPHEREDVVKSLQGEVAVLKAREARREAVEKARGLLPAGGPVEQLADLMVEMPAEQATKLENVVKALVAQAKTEALFKSFGAAGSGNADMIAESPVVKAARAHAEQVQKARGR